MSPSLYLFREQIQIPVRQESLLKKTPLFPHIAECCSWNKLFKMSASFCGQWPCPMWTCNAIYSQILGPSSTALQYELQCSSSNVDEHCNLFPVLRSLAPLWMECNCDAALTSGNHTPPLWRDSGPIWQIPYQLTQCTQTDNILQILQNSDLQWSNTLYIVQFGPR